MIISCIISKRFGTILFWPYCNSHQYFSSSLLAEPKAHGELIVYRSIRRLSVNIFKHEYIHNQWANRNQILSEASLGRGKGCIRFWTRSDRNSGVHGNGKLP